MNKIKKRMLLGSFVLISLFFVCTFFYMKTRWRKPFYNLSKKIQFIHYNYPLNGSEGATFLLPKKKNDKYQLLLTYTQYSNGEAKYEIMVVTKVPTWYTDIYGKRFPSTRDRVLVIMNIDKYNIEGFIRNGGVLPDSAKNILFEEADKNLDYIYRTTLIDFGLTPIDPSYRDKIQKLKKRK